MHILVQHFSNVNKFIELHCAARRKRDCIFLHMQPLFRFSYDSAYDSAGRTAYFTLILTVTVFEAFLYFADFFAVTLIFSL